jgi:hypothetical protein
MEASDIVHRVCHPWMSISQSTQTVPEGLLMQLERLVKLALFPINQR